MRKFVAALIVGGALAAGHGAAPAAWASDAPVVLDLEGNPTCSSLTVNRISELRVNSIATGIFTFTSGTQQIRVTFSGNTRIDRWEVLNGSDGKIENINFVILKGAGPTGAKVYHFGQTGRPFDEDELPPGNTIAQVSFCWGLQGASTVSNPPACRDLGLGINCTNPDKVIFVFDTANAFFDLQPCTCGNATLQVCNPDATSGSTTSLPACVKAPPNGNLTEVPTLVEGVKNPGTFFCTTIGGKRTCYQR
jgi:hypothetical protein